MPQAFGHSDTTTLATYHAVMLSLAPFHLANPTTCEAPPGVDEMKVFSAMVVFVHPSQKLSLIKEAVDMLLVVSRDPESVPAMALCRLPERTVGEFYPCLKHNAALVLSFSIGQDGPILHLNTPIHHCDELAMQRLHRWVHPYGPVVALPPLYSPNPGFPVCMCLRSHPCCGQTLNT